MRLGKFSIRAGFISLSFTAITLLSTASIASAQSSVPCGNLNSSDCALFRSGLENLANAESIYFHSTYSATSSMGNLSSSEIYADGEGIVIFDESGNVDEMSITIWDSRISVGSLMGNNTTDAGLFSLLLIDDVLYLGTGNDAESVVWRSADVNGVNLNRNFFSMLPLTYLAGQPGGNDWIRHDDVEIPDLMTAHSFVVAGINNNPASNALGMLGGMSGSTDGESLGGALMGSMFGSMFDSQMQLQSTYFGGIIIDPETELLHGMNIQTQTSSDVSNMLGSMNDDMFGSLLSGMVGTETGMTMSYNMTITDYNETVEWEPPSNATPLSRAELNTLLAYGNGGMDVMLQNYFVQQAAVQAMSLAMGGTGSSSSSGSNASASMTANLLSEINTGSTSGQLTSGQMDSYPFEVTEAGQTVEISLNSSAFDPYLEVQDENGNVLFHNDDYNGLNSRIMAVFPEPGTYTIVARGYRSNATGSYTLSIGEAGTASNSSTGTAAASGGEIGLGDSVNGSLVSGSQNAYTLTLTQPTDITINLDSSSFDPYLELHQNGILVAQNDDANRLNSEINATLNAGTYTIIARGFRSSAAGSYTLSVSGQTASAASTASRTLEPNASEAGRLVRGTRDQWTLVISERTPVTIQLNSNDFDTYLELYQGSSRINYNDDANGSLNSEIEATLQPGTYTVVARGFSESASGAYSLIYFER